MLMQMRRGIVLLALIAGGSGVAQAVTYDISADFSTASNPNGVWAYGFMALDGLFTPYDQPSNESGLQFWRSSLEVSGIPIDGNNPTDNFIGSVPAHTAIFHPGANGEMSIFAFTAPSAGNYQLNATFAGLDSGGTDVHILANGTPIFDAAITGGNSPSFSQSLTLSQNDRIYFALGNGGNGSANDLTGINASLTVAAVPEPEIYAMMAIGLGLMGYVTRRRKGKVAIG